MTDARIDRNSEHPIFTDPIGYQLAKVEAMAQPSPHYESDPLSAHDLYWTCASCGADYTRAEMDRAMKRGRNNVIHLMCTTCGSVGNFVDGPDA